MTEKSVLSSAIESASDIALADMMEVAAIQLRVASEHQGVDRQFGVHLAATQAVELLNGAAARLRGGK